MYVRGDVSCMLGASYNLSRASHNVCRGSYHIC